MKNQQPISVPEEQEYTLDDAFNNAIRQYIWGTDEEEKGDGALSLDNIPKELKDASMLDILPEDIQRNLIVLSKKLLAYAAAAAAERIEERKDLDPALHRLRGYGDVSAAVGGEETKGVDLFMGRGAWDVSRNPDKAWNPNQTGDFGPKMSQCMSKFPWETWFKDTVFPSNQSILTDLSLRELSLATGKVGSKFFPAATIASQLAGPLAAMAGYTFGCLQRSMSETPIRNFPPPEPFKR